MLGLMQTHPLLISSLIVSAERHHGDAEIVSRRVEGDLHRCTWRDVARRSRQLAHALDAMNLQFSDRVATLAWNGYRHLELYVGVSGSGRVLHTINPRFPPDQIAWIANHAEDQVLCFDLTFLPLIKAIYASCKTIRKYVALCDADRLPGDTGIPNLVSYEAWIGEQSDEYQWPTFDENTASSMCYTSGTTGNPKGVLYSHRSTLLHAFAIPVPDGLDLSANGAVLPVVPMFHVNAWGIPYAAMLTGCKLVLPGPAMDGKSIYELIEVEGVTCAAGVPTIWQMLLAHVQSQDLRFSTLRKLVIGGAAVNSAMIKGFEDRGAEVMQVWGMTETSPLGTAYAPKPKQARLAPEEQRAMRLKQGRVGFGIDMRIVGLDGKEAPWDGQTFGDLQVKGYWVVREYFKGEGGNPLEGDWFRTGDVATIDPDGFMQITDRSKDVIKSGGEWISSIEVENIAMTHPGVQLAACIGMPHPKWDERPIVVVVRRPGSDVTREEVLQFYQGTAAKWQVPDDVVFVDTIPLGATGKMLKTKLREMLKDYVLPIA
ncbi:3-(methylthio)propionyl-CoA ligase [Variovorax sp. RT4R15]|uniref:3-(methylthio)propionyl-CoA ligase n=1 Tax=Variovorax sp. RT4R15 TaxID=3443737 RepID=UPI003F47D226